MTPPPPEERRPPQERCLECGSPDVERLADFGAGDMTMQLRCRRCRTIFEAIKWS